MPQYASKQCHKSLRSVPSAACLNLEEVGKNQCKVHRFALKQNDKLRIGLEPASDDPDLYVLSPNDANEPFWVRNLPGAVDDLAITISQLLVQPEEGG